MNIRAIGISSFLTDNAWMNEHMLQKNRFSPSGTPLILCDALHVLI